MSSDPSGEPRQWNGMVHVSSVFCGGVLGYMAAKALLIKPLADAASATGKALPWELMVQCAAIGSIAGALFFSVLAVATSDSTGVGHDPMSMYGAVASVVPVPPPPVGVGLGVGLLVGDGVGEPPPEAPSRSAS